MAGSGSFNGGFARRIAVVLAGCAVIGGALVTTPGIASARVIKPTITHFAASPSKVTNNDGTVTVSATVANVNDNASSCTLSSIPSLNNLPVSSNCSSGSFSQTVVIPLAGKKTLKYKFTLTAVGQVAKSEKKTVTVAKGDGRPPLSGVQSVYGAATNDTESPNTYCAVLAANGAVDCWGDNEFGELGYGSLSGPQNCGGTPCALAPQSVVGVNDSGTLTGVKSLASAGNWSSFCALLTTSGEVDCWGDNTFGELGNGSQTGDHVGVPYPVQVLGVGGSGLLSGVTSLVGGDEDYCALLNTGNVVCWGYGDGGQRGDGTNTYNVDYPVDVDTAADTPLAGAVGLADDGVSGSYCAIVTGGAVDCWGDDTEGDLGNGQYGPDDCGGDACSVFASPVVGIGDTGTLSGVATVTGSDHGYCVLISGGVDCWGGNYSGELGDDSTGGNSDSPIAVKGVGGSGNLTDVSSMATAPDAISDCALLTSGSVDCWGADLGGALGDGPSGPSDVPAQVVGVNDSGTLSGVSSLSGDLSGFCTTLSSGNADCWGDDDYGELGAGNSPTCVTGSGGCASPVTVLDPAGTANLSGVTSFGGNQSSACAVVTAGDVDCWGVNDIGELGDWGTLPGESDLPVSVFALS